MQQQQLCLYSQWMALTFLQLVADLHLAMIGKYTSLLKANS